MHAIAGLARFAMADSVRKYDKKLGRFEWLILSEKFTGKLRANKLRAAAGRSMHNENDVSSLAFGVCVDLADRSIVNSQFRQCFTGGESEVANVVIAFRWRRIIGRAANARDDDH